MSQNDRKPTESGNKASSVGKIILRIAGAFFFISYLSFAGPSAWGWGWATYYKSQSLSALDSMVQSTINRPDQSDLLIWVRMRPEHEHEQIIEKLTPYSGQLDPFIFMTFSKWTARAMNVEASLFWHFYARYRIRFDALRCGAPDSVKTVEGIMSFMPDKHIKFALQTSPDLLPLLLQQVLDHDAKYPAGNNPVRICSVVQKLEGKTFRTVNPEVWPRIRHNLRIATEINIKDMTEPLPQKGTEKPKDTESE